MLARRGWPNGYIIGTFNHGWNWNLSDFFYGRDMYMWTIMGNLFLHNINHLIARRNANNNIPTFEQIFEICEKGKITFADIVKGTKNNIPTIEYPNEKCVLVNNNYRWEKRIIKNTNVGRYSDIHLDNLGALNLLDDNVKEIIDFINKTKSIKHVYFSFKSGKWLLQKLNEIRNEVRIDVNCCSIFSPTANGFGTNLQAPFNERAWSLAHCWVWNGLNHNITINRIGFGYLDHNWLRECGVEPNNF